MRKYALSGQRFFVKYIPDERFNLTGNRRRVFMGGVIVESYNISAPTGDIVREVYVLKGVTPLREDFEVEGSDLPICCEETHSTLYITFGDTFTPPPAPEGSTGWTVERNYEPLEKGTGNIGTIGVNPAPGSPGANGCPIQVAWRYLCRDSAYLPVNGITDIDKFIEIVDNSNNEGQIKVVQKMQEAVGFKIGQLISDGNADDPNSSNPNSGDRCTGFYTASDLWIEFNFFFLPDNPNYILDLSFENIQDLSIVATLVNLTRLDVSHTFITETHLEQINGLSLVYLDASFTLAGGDNLELGSMTDTLKYVDLQYCYYNESYMFSNFAAVGNPIVDYFNMSHNFLSIVLNSVAKIKKFLMIGNIFPSATFENLSDPQDFWGARWTNGDSVQNLISFSSAVNLDKDLTISELIDLSGSQLTGSTVANETSDIDDLVALLQVVQGITEIQARGIAIYNQSYTAGLPYPIYDQEAIAR